MVNYTAGTQFQGRYRVTVGAAAPDGVYTFDGSLTYYVAEKMYEVTIAGDTQVVVAPAQP
jgi:hypothetical protein